MAFPSATNATLNIIKLNEDIRRFPQVYPVTPEMKLSHTGVSRLVMLDRYSFKDTEKTTLAEGDFVVLTIKEDPKFPARGTGFIISLDLEAKRATVLIDEEYRSAIDDPDEAQAGIVNRSLDVIEKPLEVFYEQIAMRNAAGLSSVEKGAENQKKWFDQFYNELVNLNFVPAGRVLYGAGAGTEVTFFNCVCNVA